VIGFYFLDLATNYKPPDDLAAFLAAGPPPIYIGFGSVVVNDPTKMTQDIFEATKQAGVRALVSAGWGGLNPSTNIPDHIFILGNVPHDWLFTKVAAVCHHGGAGTTAIGLRLGKPTIVVPFFGDQPFWGAMIYKAGAGPKPIKKDRFDVESLKNAIKFCQTDGARKAAEALGEKIRSHDGARDGVASFYKHLPLLNMRCDSSLFLYILLLYISILGAICYRNDLQYGGVLNMYVSFAFRILKANHTLG
jgi:UDP:flavonoid glycosyltransferase YjiC (YdhE family)